MRRTGITAAAALLAMCGAVAAVTSQTAPAQKPVVADPDGRVITSEKQTFKMEVVARNLETPWALAFLPDGRLLITERPGRLRIVENGTLRPEPVKGLPKVWEKQDGGLFDVEVHPDYARNGWIYLSVLGDVGRLTGCSASAGGRARPRRSARPAVDDRRRSRKDQPEL